MMQMQQQVLKGQRELGAQVSQLAQGVSANSSMLGSLLQGEHDCPRWLVVVPKPPPKTAAKRALELLHPKSWLLNRSVVLHFVCPVTMRAVGAGFELQLPKDWVKKYGPAIRVGLTMLKLGAGVGRLAGLPIPTLDGVSGELQKQTAFLKQVGEGIAAELDAAGLGCVNEWVESKLEAAAGGLAAGASVASDTKGLVPEREVQRSYAEVRGLLDALEPTGEGWEAKVRDGRRCGLVKAVHGESGSFEWVSGEWKAAYERAGPRLLGRSEEELQEHAERV
jgi:hypothetical protein